MIRYVHALTSKHLVRANTIAPESERLDEEELMGQMSYVKFIDSDT